MTPMRAVAGVVVALTLIISGAFNVEAKKTAAKPQDVEWEQLQPELPELRPDEGDDTPPDYSQIPHIGGADGNFMQPGSVRPTGPNGTAANDQNTGGGTLSDQYQSDWGDGPTATMIPIPEQEIAPVVKKFDGKFIRLAGYVVPLDFEATKLTEFLLVPYIGACIHVPPPASNQVVYVKTKKPFAFRGLFDPVYVIGTMTTHTSKTDLAEAGYKITAEIINPYD